MHSDTAIANHINNTPTQFETAQNLYNLAVNVIEPLMDLLGPGLIHSSGYRCPKLNALVGGSSTSDHMEGKAWDFKHPTLTPAQVVEQIKKSSITYDQLLLENTWTHISFRPGKNRMMFLDLRKGG